MKEVLFKQISIRNFLSIGDEPVEIKFGPGIHIITGINKDKEDSKNGVGKSTISDAIFFGIFGSTLRPIKKEAITNWVNKKECVVSMHFDVIDNGITSEYILTRTLNPSRVQFLKNGEDISRTIGKTNETVCEILGTTPEVFEQSVIMCLNQVEPFLAKTPAIKRKFIEDIFKIEIFGQMTAAIRNDMNENKKLLDFESEKKSEMENNISFHVKKQEEMAEKKIKNLNELNSRKNSIIQEIENFRAKVTEAQIKTVSADGENKEELLQKIKKLKEKEKEIIDLDKQYAKTLVIKQTTVSTLKNKISELERLSDGVCAYCKQPFSESNKQEKRNLIDSHQKEIEECNLVIRESEESISNTKRAKQKVEDLVDELNEKHKLIEKQENQLSILNSQISQQTSWLAQVDKDIEKLSKEENTFTDILSEFNTRLLVINDNVNAYKSKSLLIEKSKFIVSDEGVKNFIIKKMLKILNGRLNYYLNKLDANCTCLFDEYFNETIINNRGKECSYFNFSGGERKRIDLAMLFTFMDIRRMQSNIYVNIGMYDELLDTSLDSIGIEGTLNILNERVLNNKEAIYIISHKNEASKHATGEIIYLEKENDITKRKPYDQFKPTNTI